MELKTEFKRLLIENGHAVYLATQSRARCSCIAYPAQEPKLDCPVCLGTGRRVALHRVLAYSRGASANPSQPNNFQAYEPGFHAVSPRLYYLGPEPELRAGDLIIEPLRSNGRFLGVQAVYRISDPYLYRMEDGSQPARAGAVTQPSRLRPVERAIRERFREEGGS